MEVLDHALEVDPVSAVDGLDSLVGYVEVFVEHFQFPGGLHEILLENLQFLLDFDVL